MTKKITNKNTIHTNNNTKNAKKHQNRIKHWDIYNEALKKRGSILELFWQAIEEDRAWKAKRVKHQVGHPQEYSDAIILFMATIREIDHLTLRETEGKMREFCELAHVTIDIPSYITLSRRLGKLKIECTVDRRRLTENSIMLIDSTGFQITGEGNWFRHKHGKRKKRYYTKGHFIIDFKSEQVLGFEITPDYVGDALTAPTILEALGTQNLLTPRLIGDGAYETRALYKFCEEHNIELLAPPRKDAKFYDDYDSTGKLKKMPEWTKRNEYVKRCQEIGKAAWEDETGYHKRSLIENFMYRIKTVFTDKLRSKTFANQKVEIAIRINLLNMWTNKYMPKYT